MTARMRYAVSRWYWWGFHSRRFIPVRTVKFATSVVLWTVCMFGVSGVVTFGIVYGADRRTSYAGVALLGSAVLLLIGVIIVVFSTLVSRAGMAYLTWVADQQNVLLDHLGSDNRWNMDLLNDWVRVPVSLERKVLLMDVGIPVAQATVQGTRALADEDLRVMAGLMAGSLFTL